MVFAVNMAIYNICSLLASHFVSSAYLDIAAQLSSSLLALCMFTVIVCFVEPSTLTLLMLSLVSCSLFSKQIRMCCCLSLGLISRWSVLLPQSVSHFYGSLLFYAGFSSFELLSGMIVGSSLLILCGPLWENDYDFPTLFANNIQLDLNLGILVGVLK